MAFPWDEADAGPPDPADMPDAAAMLTVEVGDGVFALDIGTVHEILDLRAVSPLPGAQPWILGTFDLRGASVLAVDGGAAFDLCRRPTAGEERLIVVAGGEGRALCGVVVDAVRAVESLDMSAFETLEGTGEMFSPHVDAVLRRDREAVMRFDLNGALGALGVHRS
jgi:chemotaxis signal transduction protein